MIKVLLALLLLPATIAFGNSYSEQNTFNAMCAELRNWKFSKDIWEIGHFDCPKCELDADEFEEEFDLSTCSSIQNNSENPFRWEERLKFYRLLREFLELDTSKYCKRYNLGSFTKYGSFGVLEVDKNPCLERGSRIESIYSPYPFPKFCFSIDYKRPLVHYTNGWGLDIDLHPERFYELHFIAERVKKDLTFCFLDVTSCLEAGILSDLKNQAEDINREGIDSETLERWNREYCEGIESAKIDITRMQKELKVRCSELDEKRFRMEEALSTIHDRCILKHGTPEGYYQRGIQSFFNGDFAQSMFDIQEYIRLGGEDSNLQAYLGESQVELGLFHDAIQSLNQALKLDPKSEDALLSRAISYFELGEFDKSLDDYLQYSKKKTPTLVQTSSEFASGLHKGVKEALSTLPNTFCTSFSGLAHGLWALATHPIDMSKEMISLANELGQFIHDKGVVESLKSAFPEITALANDWDRLGQNERGEQLGHIVGKYGVEVFATASIAKAPQLVRKFKRASSAATIEALKDAKKALAIRTASRAWWKKSKPVIHQLKTNSEINLGDRLFKAFRNHTLSETQLRKVLHTAGYKTFPRPRGLPKNLPVRISNKGGGMVYVKPGSTTDQNLLVRVMPGNPKSPKPMQKNPYVVQRRGNKAISATGKIVKWDDPDSHIPLSKFVFRSW